MIVFMIGVKRKPIPWTGKYVCIYKCTYFGSGGGNSGIPEGDYWIVLI